MICKWCNLDKGKRVFSVSLDGVYTDNGEYLEPISTIECFDCYRKNVKEREEKILLDEKLDIFMPSARQIIMKKLKKAQEDMKRIEEEEINKMNTQPL